jgi:sensor histidine kinase regulating citrate/malate metabolism
LQNALSKRQREGNIGISLELGVDRGSAVLRLTDTGQAIAAEIAEQLFRNPLQSEFGLGIGLYHAARQAEESGYALQLVENQPGAVIFRLAPRT